jgi:thiol-disulfide isomerase/thioredoxin
MYTKHLIIIIAVLISGMFVSTAASCQNQNAFVLEGKIVGLKNETLVFNRVQGHRELKVMELNAGSDGSFIIRLEDAPLQGQYRLRIDPAGRNAILDFLLSGEDIRFKTHAASLIDSIRFEKSKTNQAWYYYFRIKETFEARLSILEQLLDFYPKDERFFPEIIKEFNLLQNELDAEIEELVRPFPNTLLARYIQSDRPVPINPAASAQERQEFVKYNYLNHVDFTDTLLLNTDIFPGKALSYIMLYRNSRFDREQQTQEFIRATDNLLPLAMSQPTVYNYLLSYTISGFEQIGLEQVLTFIADNYPLDESCLSDQDSGELQRRMEGYRQLAPGKVAPGINIADINGKPFQLGEAGSEKILIVFWASWCPHCTVMLPEIKKLAVQKNINTASGQSPAFHVVSVSIDHSEEDYLSYLENNGLKEDQISDFWVNICDFQAWEGKVAEDYYLYATPTMILLDKDLTIIGKPATVNELNVLLGQ